MADAPLPAQPAAPQPAPEPRQRCVICYTSLRVEDKQGPEPSCGHVICDDCCRQMLTTHSDNLNSQCAICPGTYDESAIRNFLTASEFERYISIQLNVVLSRMPDIRYCVRSGCEGVGFVPATCQTNPGQGFNRPMCATVVCRDCDTAACVACRGEPHGFLSCASYASWKETHYRPQALLNSALKSVNAKSCRQCGTWTERIEGCNMVVCTNCAFRYCWECLRSLEFGCSSYLCRFSRPPTPQRAPAPAAAAPAAPAADPAADPAAAPDRPQPVPVLDRPARVPRPPVRRVVRTEADELEIPAWERLPRRRPRGPVREKDSVPEGQWAVVGKARKTPTPPVRRDRRQAIAV